jgi:hypothetical protein
MELNSLKNFLEIKLVCIIIDDSGTGLANLKGIIAVKITNLCNKIIFFCNSPKSTPCLPGFLYVYLYST